jgi:predicted DsbA family dithiol-disulfide isomerase
VEWRPFELNPETPPEGLERGTASGRSSPVIEIAHAAGIQMVRTSVIPNSRPSLEASEWVRDTAPEAFDRFHAAVFRAYFVEDRNIGDVDVLARIAVDEGLDGEALRGAVTSRAYAAAVDEGIGWAGAHGISSTPFFILVADKLYGVPGAQEYVVFEQVMERLGVPRRGDGGSLDIAPGRESGGD